MTWGDLKKSVMELMFSYTKKGVVNTSAINLDYTLAMPDRANEAFDELTDLRPTIKGFALAQCPPENIIEDSGDLFSVNRTNSVEDTEYTAVNPKSYYFECSGGYIDAYIEKENGTVWDEIRHVSQAGLPTFVAFSGLIVDDGTYRVRFSISATHPLSYLYRNVAFYAESFSAVSEIPPYSAYVKYDVRNLLSAVTEPGIFKRLAAEPVVLEGGDQYRDAGRREKPVYYIEGDSIVYIKREYIGQVMFYYEASPVVITSSTDDSEELLLDMAILIAASYYMAGMLYSEDSESISNSYIKQYEQKKALIVQQPIAAGIPEFMSESGWS